MQLVVSLSTDATQIPNIPGLSEQMDELCPMMRALGFSRTVILTSFVLESMALGFAGGLLGTAISSAVVSLLLTAPTWTSNFTTFAEILFNFELTPSLILSGVVFSLAMGLFGGLFPAARAARLKITSALREA